jgi:hypothetical protein
MEKALTNGHLLARGTPYRAVKDYRRILQPPCSTDIDLSKEHCLAVRCHEPILETHVKHVFSNLAYLCVSTRIKHGGVSLT